MEYCIENKLTGRRYRKIQKRMEWGHSYFRGGEGFVRPNKACV